MATMAEDKRAFENGAGNCNPGETSAMMVSSGEAAVVKNTPSEAVEMNSVINN